MYTRIRLDSFANPPNGSWGMVKVRHTKALARSRNPPNGSWGMVKVRHTKALARARNPPNGSWGMVKVQPQSPIAVGRRPSLNDPPTAVGGIQEKLVFWFRLSFNDPPTAVGGFSPRSSPLSWRACARYCISIPMMTRQNVRVRVSVQSTPNAIISYAGGEETMAPPQSRIYFTEEEYLA